MDLCILFTNCNMPTFGYSSSKGCIQYILTTENHVALARWEEWVMWHPIANCRIPRRLGKKLPWNEPNGSPSNTGEPYQPPVKRSLTVQACTIVRVQLDQSPGADPLKTRGSRQTDHAPAIDLGRDLGRGTTGAAGSALPTGTTVGADRRDVSQETLRCNFHISTRAFNMDGSHLDVIQPSLRRPAPLRES